jgi:hypothetical protein
MRLWTIQTEEAFRLLERRGVLRGDGRRVDPDYRKAYVWMVKQMVLRIGKPPGRSRAPVWAWKICSRQSPKPDLRSTGHLPSGTAGVRIEFEASPDSVLLSDFTRWHNVLSGYFLDDNADDGAHLVGMKFEDRVALIEKSWERIFELERGNPDYWGALAERGIQATPWQIEWAQVRKVTRFTARQRRRRL